jgi:MFS family permease
VVIVCGLVSAIGNMLMSQIQTVWQFYLFYGVLTGIGTCVWVPLLSTVSRWFVQKRSLMTGIVIGGSGVGSVLAPPTMNQLIAAYDWRTACLLMGIITVIVVVVAAQFLKSDPLQIGQLVYRENATANPGLKTLTNAFSLKEAVHTRQFWIFFTMMIFYGFAILAIQVHMVPYATDLGISAASAAAILATAGGASIIGQMGLGSIGDKIGNKRAFIIGIVLVSLAIVGLTLNHEVWIFYLLAAIFGLGLGTCGTQESPLVAWLFGLASHGLIYGILCFSFSVGAALGPALFGYVFDITGSYQIAFLLGICLTIFTILLIISLKPTNTASASK